MILDDFIYGEMEGRHWEEIGGIVFDGDEAINWYRHKEIAYPEVFKVYRTEKVVEVKINEYDIVDKNGDRTVEIPVCEFRGWKNK